MPNLRGKTWTTTTPANVEDAQYWEDHLISDTAAAKAASSVQTVNSTPPDASGNVDVVALPSGGTLGQVLTKQSSADGDADWEDPASSGHTIEDEDGNTMPYQSTLQFVNAEVTNDAVNSKTVVDCKGAKGDAATVTAGTTTTLPAGSSATVVNAGTTSAAVFNFGIPQGADGADGTDGVSVTGVTLLSTSGKVKTYRMSFSDGSYFDYNVTDGSDGTGAGDMLMSDYDSQANVKSAGGIDTYVAGEIGKLDVSDSAVSGQYVSAVSEADGKISVTRASLPTVPTKVSDLTNDSGYQTASDVATAISGKEDKSALKDLAYIAKDGVGSTKVLQGDGTWVNPSAGHTMINNATYLPTMVAISTDATDDKVASTYAIANWSNAEITTLIAHIDSGDDTVGVWNDAWETDGIRTGWVWHECLYHTIPDNEVEISIDFAIGGKEVVGLYAYRVDDEVAHNGVNGGAIAIKLTSPIQNASGVDVAINLKRQRTNLVTNPTILS